MKAFYTIIIIFFILPIIQFFYWLLNSEMTQMQVFVKFSPFNVLVALVAIFAFIRMTKNDT